jgi:hypothetical protein
MEGEPVEVRSRKLTVFEGCILNLLIGTHASPSVVDRRTRR